MDKGHALQKEIIAPTSGTACTTALEDELHIQHYLSANRFRDYVNCAGLDVRTRELVALGGYAPK